MLVPSVMAVLYAVGVVGLLLFLALFRLDVGAR